VLTILSLLASVTVAVYSPLLSLESITIAGTSQLEASEVLDAVDGQLGTPLALVDFEKVTHELSAFALIRSFTTESVPPHSLVITIVERQPIAVVADGTSFAVVDPAGVVIDSVGERSAGIPLLDAGEASIGNPAFRSAVEVLLVLPADLLARVDTISASTKDDVAFTLVGGTQSVRWGSDDRSGFKARVLAALVATQDQSKSLEYDVSAPDAPVIRPR
jgi:cell division protein FtsQ